jgi:hypothetical protein
MSDVATTTPRRQDVELLDRITTELITKHGITLEDFKHAPGFDSRVGKIAAEMVMSLSPQALARLIAAFPSAGLRACHGTEFLSSYDTGPYLLQQLAATVLMCRMKFQLSAPDSGTGYFEDWNRGFPTAQ